MTTVNKPTKLNLPRWTKLVRFMRSLRRHPPPEPDTWTPVEVRLNARVVIDGDPFSPGIYWGPM